MSKSSFKNYVSNDIDLKKETSVKVLWTPIKLNEEQEVKPSTKKSSLKSLKEIYKTDLEIPEQKTEKPQHTKISLVEETIIENAVVEERVLEEVVLNEEELKEEVVLGNTKSIIDKAAEHITKEARLHEQDSFQQPNVPIVDSNFNSVTKKINQLEKWLSKIAAHGAGGGDANPHDQIEFLERGIRFTPTPRMMYWNNTEDCVNITQADGSTLQVGLENYIRVYNNTANTFFNGTFVEFTGVDDAGDAPTFRAYINDANAEPLYNIGVLTTDVLSNTHGRATVLGLVRDIDTTGNAVGEVWSDGDILWANPSYPGNYTKFKPTAPNVALSVAAVTTTSPVNGVILVRPTVWPRLYYGDFYHDSSVIASGSDLDREVPFSDSLITSGFLKSGNSIIALESGLYKFDFRAQLTSTNSSDKSIVLWFKKNKINIPFSAVRTSVATNGGYATVTNTQIISLTPSDNVTIHYSVTDTSLRIDTPASIGGAPNIPAVQLAVTEVAL